MVTGNCVDKQHNKNSQSLNKSGTPKIIKKKNGKFYQQQN